MYSLKADPYPHHSQSLLPGNNSTTKATQSTTTNQSSITQQTNDTSQMDARINVIAITNPLDTLNKINYPIQDIPHDFGNSIPLDQRQLVPSRATISKRKYSTSIDDRNFLTVYEFMINGSWIIWDYYTGLVHLTGLWKSIGNSKADIVKLLDSSPELESKVKRVRGGFLRIQGTWVPFEIGRQLATRFCYSIRYALVPIFGPDFVESCLKPNEKGFGMLRLNIDEQDFNENNKKKRRRRSKKVIMEQRMLLEEKKRLKNEESLRLEVERERERERELMNHQGDPKASTDFLYNQHQMMSNSNISSNPSSYFIAPKQEPINSILHNKSSSSSYRLPPLSPSIISENTQNTSILSTSYFLDYQNASQNGNKISHSSPVASQQPPAAFTQQSTYFPPESASTYEMKHFKSSSRYSPESDEDYEASNSLVTHHRFKSFSSETKHSSSYPPPYSGQYQRLSTKTTTAVATDSSLEDQKNMIEAANSLINVKHRLSMSYNSQPYLSTRITGESSAVDSTKMTHSGSVSSTSSSSTSLYSNVSSSPLNTTAMTASPSTNLNSSYTYKMVNLQSSSISPKTSRHPSIHSQNTSYLLPSSTSIPSAVPVSSDYPVPLKSQLIESGGLLMDLNSNSANSSPAASSNIATANVSHESNIRYHLTAPLHIAADDTSVSTPSRKMTIGSMLL